MFRRQSEPHMIFRTIKPLLVEAIQLKEPADVPVEGGVLHVKPGEWLLRDAQGNLTRCDDMSFKCSYEPVDGRNGLEFFSEGKPCGC